MKSIMELGQTSRRQLDIVSIQPLLSIENERNFTDWSQYIIMQDSEQSVFYETGFIGRSWRGSMPEIVDESTSRAFAIGLPS